MKKCIIPILISFFILTAGTVSFFFARAIPVSTSISFLESLTLLSSIILGVMGVWLSLIWNEKTKSRSENIKYVKNSMIFSSLIVFYTISIKLIYPVLIQIPKLFDPRIVKILRIVCYFSSWISTLLVFISLLYVIFSFDFFTFDDLQKEADEAHQKKLDQQTSITQKYKKKE